MHLITVLVASLTLLIVNTTYANEISYEHCKSIQDVIDIETKEISTTHLADYDELAHLYASRGESYLLNAQYDEAIKDFNIATSYTSFCCDLDNAMGVAFRAAFGKVVCYDNLGIVEQTQLALDELQAIVARSDCNDCLEDRPCQGISISSSTKLYSKHSFVPYSNRNIHFRDMIFVCKSKKSSSGESQSYKQEKLDEYKDILGPDHPPQPNWCEEVVTGVGRAMDAIACLAPNYAVKVALIGVIETLITRGVKCCQAGGFWKTCVAPITRKWREWKNNKENKILPSAPNLYLYVD